MLDRRHFLKISALSGSIVLLGNINPFTARRSICRSFGLCVNTKTLNTHPDFLNLIADSGITGVWMPLFINGYWPYPVEDVLTWKERFEKKGIAVNIVSVPFGHPGGSLGDSQNYDITPDYWPRRVDMEGIKYSGTSVHPSITQENISVIQKVEKLGFSKLFLDDDERSGSFPL